MHFIYVGDFHKDWSTEYIIADHLVKAGHRVAKFQEENFDTSSIVEHVKRYAKMEDPGLILLFTKCQVRGISFRSSPDPLRRVLEQIKEAGIKIVCRQFDLLRREFCPNRFAWAQTIASVCDLFCSTDAGLNIPNNVLLRQGCPGPIRVGGQHNSNLVCDIAHVGGVYTGRTEWWSELRESIGG